MKIILNGVETNNKGAELMLYAILQEIERKHPEAVVYFPAANIRQGKRYVQTSLSIKYLPFSWFVNRLHLGRLFRILHLPTRYLQDIYAIKGADYFIDGSGFHFSDQKKNFTSDKVWKWKHLLGRLNGQGCRIVFLPQAFGPAQKANTLNGLRVLGDYASLIFPREQTSYNYLEQSGVVNMDKVKLFTDFTSLVEGVFPEGYEHLKDGICIIPNLRMIDTGTVSKENYIGLISAIVNSCKASGRPIYLLNHEGKGDEQLAYECKKSIGNNIKVVTGLNALEVKGLISSAYLVISSRFHGVTSSLNSCVPCLATSWSHKYHELFNDYGMDGCVLPLDNITQSVGKVKEYLDEQNNAKIREHLSQRLPSIKERTRLMWDFVWKEK